MSKIKTVNPLLPSLFGLVFVLVGEASMACRAKGYMSDFLDRSRTQIADSKIGISASELKVIKTVSYIHIGGSDDAHLFFEHPTRKDGYLHCGGLSNLTCTKMAHRVACSFVALGWRSYPLDKIPTPEQVANLRHSPATRFFKAVVNQFRKPEVATATGQR